MKIAKFAILLFVLNFPLRLAAEGNPKHSINAALEKCLHEKKETFPQAECYGAASKMWERTVAALKTYRNESCFVVIGTARSEK